MSLISDHVPYQSLIMFQCSSSAPDHVPHHVPHHPQDEKRYYELELVNRESNYNKVFSSAPKIGVMNPMGKGAATLKVREITLIIYNIICS